MAKVGSKRHPETSKLIPSNDGSRLPELGMQKNHHLSASATARRMSSGIIKPTISVVSQVWIEASASKYLLDQLGKKSSLKSMEKNDRVAGTSS